MNPDLIQMLLQLHERNLKFGSPLLQLAFQKLVPNDAGGPDQPSGAEAWRASPGLLDALRAQQLIVEEVTRIHRLLLQLLAESAAGAQASTDSPAAQAVASPTPDPPGPSVLDPAANAPQMDPPAPDTVESSSTSSAPDPEAVVRDVLKQAERLLLLHPMAAQAAFSALVAQGRRFATTPEGQALAQGLANAPILAKLRRVWETTTLNMLEEQPTTVLPNMYVEAIFRAAKSANLEDLLSPQKAKKETERQR